MSKRHKTLERLYKRDGGWCRLCGLAVDRKHEDKHQRATIDHVVPKAKGGKDNFDNLQLAHAKCNWAKADVLEGEQK